MHKNELEEGAGGRGGVLGVIRRLEREQITLPHEAPRLRGEEEITGEEYSEENPLLQFRQSFVHACFRSMDDDNSIAFCPN